MILKKHLNRQNQIKEIEKSLNKVGLTDNFTFKKLYDQIFNTQRIAPNWEYIPDFENMLSGIRIRKILKWYKKRGLTLEDLLWLGDELNNKAKLHLLLDEIWLTDEAVFKQLKYIMENAYYIVKLWKDDFVPMRDNKVVNAAINEYSKLKDYIEDDSLNAMNLFKVDNHRLQVIFWDEALPSNFN